ncbi:50S ribosomal protein L6 [Patescibacteria group bacterium]
MSLIGLKPITIKEQVEISIEGDTVSAKGPKGELKSTLPLKNIKVEIKDKEIFVTRKSETRQIRANHGLVRSLIQNIVIGVSEGFEKKLELVGTGYRVAKQGDKLTLSLGYSHPIEYLAPEGIKLDIEGNNVIFIRGIDKQKVGQVAAEIRAKRPPEPYKGKGIKYSDEVIRRKAGKTTTV